MSDPSAPQESPPGATGDDPPPAPSASSVERKRLFIAIPLADHIVDRLAELSVSLRKGFQFGGCQMSWTAPHSIHLTLRFLGDTENARIAAIAEEFERVVSGFPPLELKGRDVGVFPHWRRPRVLWAGVDERNGALTRLQSEIESLVRRHGFEGDSKEFHPHLTLGRFKSTKGTRAAESVVRSHRNFKTDAFRADEVVLFSSLLRPQGPVHEKIKIAKLAVPC